MLMIMRLTSEKQVLLFWVFSTFDRGEYFMFRNSENLEPKNVLCILDEFEISGYITNHSAEMFA